MSIIRLPNTSEKNTTTRSFNHEIMKSSRSTSHNPNEGPAVQKPPKRSISPRSLPKCISRTGIPILSSARNREAKPYQIVHHENLNPHRIDRVFDNLFSQKGPPKPRSTTLAARPPTLRPERRRLGANRFGPKRKIKRRVITQGTGYQGTARPSSGLKEEGIAVPKQLEAVNYSVDGTASPQSRKSDRPIAADMNYQGSQTKKNPMKKWKEARDALLAEGATQGPRGPKKRPFEELEDPSAKFTSWGGAGNAFERRW